jgi:NAD(P)H-hydrate epimerase
MKACTAEQMRAIDERAASEYGMPTLLLMENAGRAVSERALRMLRKRKNSAAPPRVQVLCGKGNNGGDGFVAARHLLNRGARVECLLAGDPAEVRGDARVNMELLEKLGLPVQPRAGGTAPRLDADLLVDALLGTGFRGEPRGPVGAMITAINEAGLPVLAVDLPSGLDADTGRPASLCVRATETVTFGLPKVGLLGYPGRALAGKLAVANISLPHPLLEHEALRAEWITSARAGPLWPARDPLAHKGGSGKLLVLAGSVGLTGAATLCCEAALRSGVGLVTLGIPASLNDALEVKLTEAMTLPLPETETRAHSPESLPIIRERLEGTAALAAGPGFGRHPRSGELLRALAADCPVPLVVDADGLNLLSPARENTFPAHCVITPHPGEIARLLGTEVAAVESNRLETAREAAARFGCVVLLKGPATVVAAPDGRLGINSSGGPALATGGAGDVLTGMVAACLARGLEPYEAAAAAVYLHGVAGDVAGERFGAPGAIAGDVVAAIPEALRRLQAGEIPLPCKIV